MKVLKHKIIVQNTEEPDSICIEDEYYEPTEDEETVVDFEFLWYCNEDKLNKLIELNIDNRHRDRHRRRRRVKDHIKL
jgi:hypothetical protein